MNLTSKHRVIYHSIYLCLILVFFSELILGSKQLSLTSDEPPHITHGYLMLKTGDTWALSEHRHPPLLNMLAALPLLLQPEQPDPAHITSWNEDFVLYVRALWPQLGPIERLAYTTRFTNILISMLLLTLVIRWCRDIVHPLGGILSGLMMVIDPTLVAHAQLNTTDIGLTFFALLTIYLADHIPQKKEGLFLISSGLALGCTMTVKASGIILAPIVSLILLWRLVQQYAGHNVPVREYIKHISIKWLIHTIIVGGVSTACIFVIYALPRLFSGNCDLISAMIEHIDLLSLTFSERNRTAFLAGEIRQGGWWWYFPFAYALKTPIPSILFLLLSSAALISNPKTLLKWVSLWLFPFTYLVLSVRSNLNIGYRHLLPVFPYFYIAVGGFLNNRVSGPKVIDHSSKRTSPVIWRLSIILLFLWQTVDMALVFPFPLAYFNAFAGGPSNGYHYLVDSNVDWGQSFLALRKYLQVEHIPWTWLSYYTWIDPAVYDIPYRPLPPVGRSNTFPRRYNPLPGVYTFSATTLQGIMIADPDLYDWFSHREPTAQPGFGLLVFHIKPKPNTPQWVAQCTTPISPLAPTDISQGFGDAALRIINFDCSDAWIYPREGTVPGWYILHGDVLNSNDTFVNGFLEYSSLSYRQRVPRQLPAFAIYNQAENELPSPLPAQAVFGKDWLELTGYSLSSQNPKPGQTIEVNTWWSVLSVPNRPLSLMLHGTDAASGSVLVGDGLGIPVTEWQAGDIIVQRHRITLPLVNAPVTYDIAVGVYWLDTMDRWEASTEFTTRDNAVIITQIRVK